MPKGRFKAEDYIRLWQDYIQPRMLDIRGIVTAMPPSKTPTSDTVELVGALRLPLGGVNGYKHVRGKQGRAKDLFQGTTPRKSRRTALFGTAREAAIALAELKEQQPDHPGRADRVDDPIKLLDFSSPLNMNFMVSGMLVASESESKGAPESSTNLMPVTGFWPAKNLEKSVASRPADLSEFFANSTRSYLIWVSTSLKLMENGTHLMKTSRRARRSKLIWGTHCLISDIVPAMRLSSLRWPLSPPQSSLSTCVLATA